MPDKKTILEEAQEIVAGPRREAYGHPRHNFALTADIANLLLPGHQFTPEDVPMFMVAVKLAREVFHHKRDNLVDLCGYLETLDQLHDGETCDPAGCPMGEPSYQAGHTTGLGWLHAGGTHPPIEEVAQAEEELPARPLDPAGSQVDEPPFILTNSGVHFHLLNPVPSEVVWADVAHSLAYLCRFTGHTNTFWSVASHSLGCAAIAYHLNLGDRIELLCLIHDAAEAYVNDIASPLKAILPQYKKVENKIGWAIFDKVGMGVYGFEGDWVKRIDRIAVRAEANVLLPVALDVQSLPGWPDLPNPEDADTQRWYERYVTENRARPTHVVASDLRKAIEATICRVFDAKKETM